MNNCTNIINIRDTNYTYREAAEYSTDKTQLFFESEEAFLIYKKNVIDKHATWCYHLTSHSKKKYDFDNNPLLKQARLLVKSITYQCDHAGSPRKKKNGNTFFILNVVSERVLTPRFS